MKANEKGSSLLIVLVLLTVMALGALSLARVTHASTTIAGNMAFKAAALQASEVGLADAFARLQALSPAEVNTDKAGWYFATAKQLDNVGLPCLVVDSSGKCTTPLNWTAAASGTVPGGYTVRYAVERMCTGTMPVSEENLQCFVKRIAAGGSAKAGAEKIDAPAAVQYRITAYVLGPKGTQSFVQVMATKGAEPDAP